MLVWCGFVRTLTPRRSALPSLLAITAPLQVLACGRPPLAPSTVEGPARRYVLVELTRHAEVIEPGVLIADQGGCRYHVNAAGDFWGDHYGWCDDFKILPAAAPGYLVATTIYGGAASGGYSRLFVLPPLPGSLPVFGYDAALRPMPDRAVQITLGTWAATVPAGHSITLGRAATPVLVEGSTEAGHVGEVDPRSVLARVTFDARNHGVLDSRRIGGRGPIRP